MAKILITDGRIWDGERFFYGDVLAENGIIVKIAGHIETDLTQHDLHFDAAGMTVCPGLVDMHVHIRGISSNAYGTPIDSSSFPFGVTAAADASGVHGDSALLDSFMVKNCVFVTSDLADNKAYFEKAEEMLKLYGDKAVGIKVYFDKGIAGVTDITPLREVCAWARERSLIVMVHCTGSPTSMAEILETLSPGDILTHVFHGGGNTSAADGFACVRAAKERGVIIDSGFAGYVHTDMAVLQKAAAAGIFPDTISTDITKLSAFTRGGRYGMTMCMNMALRAGMAEEDILRAVTSAPAKALGRETAWGYLQEGRSADIAVLEMTDESFDLTDSGGNRFTSENGWRCMLTVSDGQVVWHA
ncbi:MAG: amidohydrolase family protein [Oscillospiraceae bacterium]|nr:amidohydrolase family protein [Oscillospiraceae bacterium]